MDNLKKKVLNKLKIPYMLFCVSALLLCVCTDVPEHCGDRFPALNPSAQFCNQDNQPWDRCGGLAYNTSTHECYGGRVRLKEYEYAVTISSAGKGYSGGGSYAAGVSVSISAGTAPEGQMFKNWTTASNGVSFADANKDMTAFTMPANAVTVTANFEMVPTPTPMYAVTVTSAGMGSSGGGSYAAGATVSISAGTAPAGQQFKNWTTTNDDVTLADANNAMTTFTMPANAVTVTAVFETVPTPVPTYYAVTVTSAGTGSSGGGNYAAGATVSISAGTAPAGQQFKNWTTMNDGVTFDNANNVMTTFTMPSNAVTVTANFETSPVVTPEMVFVAGGTFTMGCTAEQGNDCYDDEKTISVTLSSYYIGKYEVTQGLWKAVMGSNPSHFTGNDSLPVERVSWNMVKVFIDSLNRKTGKTYRLPTEAEWEYAARGGKSGGFKYSGSDNINNVAWYGDNSDSKTHVVGTKAPNGLGIYDMSGNVWEWVSDWYGSYSSGAQTNPTGPTSGSNRVYRGGSWYGSARNCRVSYRDSYYPDFSNYGMGFRLVSLSP